MVGTAHKYAQGRPDCKHVHGIHRNYARMQMTGRWLRLNQASGPGIWGLSWQLCPRSTHQSFHMRTGLTLLQAMQEGCSSAARGRDKQGVVNQPEQHCRQVWEFLARVMNLALQA